MPHWRRQTFHRIGQCVAQQRRGRLIRLGGPDQRDLRRRREPTAAIDDERGDNASVPSCPAALLQDTAGQRHEALAILRDAADRYFIDNRGGTAAEPNHVTILDNKRLIYLASARQLSMSGKVACLPMYRDRDPRPDHLIHAYNLDARRVSRDMFNTNYPVQVLDTHPHQ